MKATRLEIGGERPELEDSVEFALYGFFGDQRWRAIKDRCAFFEIDAIAQGVGFQEQPALVYGSPGDADFLALEIIERFDRSVFRHHGADGGGVRIKDEFGALSALARHPKPVGNDDIGGAALNSDLASLCRSEFRRVNLQPRIFIETKG